MLKTVITVVYPVVITVNIIIFVKCMCNDHGQTRAVYVTPVLPTPSGRRDCRRCNRRRWKQLIPMIRKRDRHRTRLRHDRKNNKE